MPADTLPQSGIYTEDALKELAEALATTLNGNETIYLSGELGSGKTTFTRYLVTALNPQVTVASPTFQLVNEYPLLTGGQVIHADLYRLSHADDVITLGLTDYIEDERTITIIEWPELCAPHLPQPSLHLEFIHRSPSTRQITQHRYV